MSSRVIMSVDVEDWYHGPTMAGREVHSGGAAVERAYPYVNSCLELFSTHGIKATFFWVAEYARRFPHLIRAVVDQGHEIACHGMWHVSKMDPRTKQNTYSRDEFRRITTEAKSILEDH